MRYIIDVTQLVHWPGNLTGIPRVMDELSIRFHKYDSNDSIFVSWVKDLGEMCEIDFASTRSHRGNGIDYLRMSAVGGEQDVRTINTKQRLKRNSFRAFRKLSSLSHFDRTNTYDKLIRTGRTIDQANYIPYVPKKDDKIFIPWGEWWDQEWLNKVRSYAEEGAQVYPVCHDILPMVVPHFSGNSSSLADFVTQVFPVSKAVIVQSNSTKNDLTKWMRNERIDTPPVKIFRLGEDFGSQKTTVVSSEMIAKYGIKKDEYLVYVSTIEPRKNHTLLYYTYKLAHSRNIQLPKLLIIGRVGHDSNDIIKFIKEDAVINQSIVICDFVSDNELNWLYQNCKFTVAPSFYEGWGMSVVESIAKGKPAVCSNTSSLNEMPDDCVIRFNPNSTDECLDAIMSMNKPGNYTRYKRNAEQYKLHSWDDSYKQVLKIMENN